MSNKSPQPLGKRLQLPEVLLVTVIMAAVPASILLSMRGLSQPPGRKPPAASATNKPLPSAASVASPSGTASSSDAASPKDRASSRSDCSSGSSSSGTSTAGNSQSSSSSSGCASPGISGHQGGGGTSTSGGDF